MRHTKKCLDIAEISACSNKESAKALRYTGASETRILILVKELLKQHRRYDILSVRDASWKALTLLRSYLGTLGYSMLLHPQFASERSKGRYTCLSALFILDTVEYEQLTASDLFPTIYRYNLIKIMNFANPLFYKSSHVPCVTKDTPAQLHRKAEMLKDEVLFQRSAGENLVLSTGDFNGAPNAGKYYCQPLLDCLCFTDLVTEPTFGTKRLDHVFASDALRSGAQVAVSAEVLDTGYMTHTDHKVVSIRLRENQILPSSQRVSISSTISTADATILGQNSVNSLCSNA